VLGNSGKGGGLEDDVDVAIVVVVGVEVVLAAPGSPAVEIRFSSLTSGYHNMEFSPTEALVALPPPPPPPPPPLSHGFGGDGEAISPSVATHHSVIGSRATSRLCVIWLGQTPKRRLEFAKRALRGLRSQICKQRKWNIC
jgi:hypothetical protein